MQPLAFLFALLAALPLAGLAQLTQQQLAALPALRRILVQRILLMHRYASIESGVRLVDLVVHQWDVRLQNRRLFVSHRSARVSQIIFQIIHPTPAILRETDFTEYFSKASEYLEAKRGTRGTNGKRHTPSKKRSNLGKKNRRTLSYLFQLLLFNVVNATWCRKTEYVSGTWIRVRPISPRKCNSVVVDHAIPRYFTRSKSKFL